MDQKPQLLRQRSAYEQGLADGRIAKISNARPSTYAIVGTDEYAQAYRAAYFSRAATSASQSPPSFDIATLRR